MSGSEGTRVYISFDLEGVSGIADWAQCTPEGRDYEIGVELTTAEINAVIDGAVAGGATSFVVNDAHYKMRNLHPDQLHHQASYVSGSHKPLYMMEGLDESFDVIFFVGYHGSISGEPSILSHTYNPSVFHKVTLDGHEVGEAGINALVAAHFGVPIGLITGDQVTATQNAPVLGNIPAVVVKESISRVAATHLHPSVARTMLSEAATKVISDPTSWKLPKIERSCELEMFFMTSDMAEMATWARGVERSSLRSAIIKSENFLEAYRSFVTVSYLTRQAGGR